MDVDADVALLRHERLAGVDAHAHAHRPVRERALRRLGRRERVRRPREGDEERVALGVDLDARRGAERLAQHAPVLAEHVRVAVAELVQQPRRALDVGEEERDGAARERRTSCDQDRASRRLVTTPRASGRCRREIAWLRRPRVSQRRDLPAASSRSPSGPAGDRHLRMASAPRSLARESQCSLRAGRSSNGARRASQVFPCSSSARGQQTSRGGRWRSCTGTDDVERRRAGVRVARGKSQVEPSRATGRTSDPSASAKRASPGSPA